MVSKHKVKKKKWVARKEVIYKMVENGMLNESLSLQNKRNMLVAIQGDNQAIAKSQLETFTMLGYQMERLNITVTELGNIQNEMLQLAMDENTDDLNFTKEKVTLEKLKYPIEESERKWQYNKYGMVELITNTKKRY